MKLNVLLTHMQPLAVSGASDTLVQGITYDSRQVREGFIFCALPGQRADGHDYIEDALQRGAVAIVSERAAPLPHSPVAFIQTRDARQALALLAKAFYGDPSRRLAVVGITGTNGKTTTAFMVRDILRAAERQPGLIGTVNYEIGARIIPATRTTPEASDLQRLLAEMVRVGCRSAVLEVTSHALVQQRVAGLEFAAALFTNLTHDHLDYHGTFAEYFEAKALLFRSLMRQHTKAPAIINVDDPWGEKLAQLPELQLPLITCSLEREALVRVTRMQVSAAGTEMDVESPWGRVSFAIKLLGRFNAANALLALAAAGALGIAPELSAGVLAQIACVPGRLEEIKSNQGFQVFVDYAHTEDALQNVLSTLREITTGRLLVVFGCGGNRDQKKRPLMGAVAARLADYIILTSDNPRKENPSAIIAQIRGGIPGSDQHEVIEDRYEAIARALALAEEGDSVLIAGKGHENYQEFADTVIPFDDRQVVRECLGIRE